MTNQNKKAYESPKLTAEGTIAGLTQGSQAFSGSPATTGVQFTTTTGPE